MKMGRVAGAHPFSMHVFNVYLTENRHVNTNIDADNSINETIRHDSVKQTKSEIDI